MEIQKGSVKKVAMQYGLILGLSTVILSVVVYVLGQTYDQPWWQSLIGFALMLGCIIYAIKGFKTDNGGFLSLGEALKVGLATALIAGIIGVVFNMVFSTFIEPDFMANLREAEINKLIEQSPNMSDDQMELSVSIIEKMVSPAVLGAMGIIIPLFLGFIISLIAGLIMKVVKPEHLE